mmetsp:Transcript_23805/g.70659  ORF Transcript_23805/g.70659 Transcript_23805/m.70659 type:complete len:222 (+) Transcript_23805:2304-2969(+)
MRSLKLHHSSGNIARRYAMRLTESSVSPSRSVSLRFFKPSSFASTPPSSAYSTSSSYSGVSTVCERMRSRLGGLSSEGWDSELTKKPSTRCASSLIGVASATVASSMRLSTRTTRSISRNVAVAEVWIAFLNTTLRWAGSFWISRLSSCTTSRRISASCRSLSSSICFPLCFLLTLMIAYASDSRPVIMIMICSAKSRMSNGTSCIWHILSSSSTILMPAL